MIESKIKELTILYPKLGEITISNGITNEMNEKIGSVIGNFSSFCYYHGQIYEDDFFIEIYDLRVLKDKSFNIGRKKIGTGYTTYINVIVNEQLQNIFRINKKNIINAIL